MDKLRGRSPEEFCVRSLQALMVRLERVQCLFGGSRLAGSPGRKIAFSIERSFASLRHSSSGIEGTARAVAARDRDWESKLRERSRELDQGFVSLLGCGSLRVGCPPLWHREALSGQEAPRWHWSRINHLSTSIVGDHKVLWELNRHQYLLAPAFCWILDHDQGQFELIQLHLRSWLAENPPGIGVNWVSSLEIAYRAIAWCWLLWLLRDAPWDANLRTKLIASLEAHARHVDRHLSTYFSPNTHLTGEALGLFYVGTVLQGSKHAVRWRAKGAAILESWLDRHVLPDGVYFEHASQYHRYTTEIYLHYALLAESTGWKVSVSVRHALGRLFDVLRSLACSAGCIPLLGDDDGGLLLPLDHRSPDDIRSLLIAGAVFLERPELVVPTASPVLAYWLCGVEATDRLMRIGGALPGWRDMHFAVGGLAVLRDGWAPEDAVAVIDAGPHGSLNCGHSHADALAMTLALGSTPLFVDRGTMTYAGPKRDEYRSTGSHNTLEIDRESSVMPGRPFHWLNVPPPARGAIYSSAAMSGFAGVAYGHAGHSSVSTHRRWVLHQRGGAWVILDRAERAGARGGTLRWQLPSGLRGERVGTRSAVVRSHEGVAIATVMAPFSPELRVAARCVSPRLGREVAAEVLEIAVDASLEALTVVVLGLPKGIAEKPASITAGGPGVFAWADAAGSHRVSVSPASGAANGVEADGDLCWWIDRSLASTVPAFPSELFAAFGVRSLGADGSERCITDAADICGKMIVLERVSGRWKDGLVCEPQRWGN